MSTLKNTQGVRSESPVRCTPEEHAEYGSAYAAESSPRARRADAWPADYAAAGVTHTPPSCG